MKNKYYLSLLSYVRVITALNDNFGIGFPGDCTIPKEQRDNNDTNIFQFYNDDKSMFIK